MAARHCLHNLMRALVLTEPTSNSKLGPISVLPAVAADPPGHQWVSVAPTLPVQSSKPPFVAVDLAQSFPWVGVAVEGPPSGRVNGLRAHLEQVCRQPDNRMGCDGGRARRIGAHTSGKGVCELSSRLVPGGAATPAAASEWVLCKAGQHMRGCRWPLLEGATHAPVAGPGSYQGAVSFSRCRCAPVGLAMAAPMHPDTPPATIFFHSGKVKLLSPAPAGSSRRRTHRLLRNEALAAVVVVALCSTVWTCVAGTLFECV